MDTGTDFIKTRAPTLYGIIVFKLGKGVVFLALAFVLYCFSDNNLGAEWSRFLGQDSVQQTLHVLRVHPDNKFFTHLAEYIARITEANMLVAAAGTLFYSLFSLVEGIGLIFRMPWAGWMAIGESGLLIPVEVYELTRPGKASWLLFAVLVTNVIIVWYLVQNRHRLFRHHFHHHQAAQPVEKPAA